MPSRTAANYLVSVVFSITLTVRGGLLRAVIPGQS